MEATWEEGLLPLVIKDSQPQGLHAGSQGNKYPVTLASILHIGCGSKQKTNYLTFLTFFICERGNNIYLSELCEN